MRKLACLVFAASAAGTSPVHFWEKLELTFTAARAANPYTDVTVWVDLSPRFHKPVYDVGVTTRRSVSESLLSPRVHRRGTSGSNGRDCGLKLRLADLR